jgi:hypothetical protein
MPGNYDNLGQIKYMRATDAEGAAWGAPVTVYNDRGTINIPDAPARFLRVRVRQ